MGFAGVLLSHFLFGAGGWLCRSGSICWDSSQLFCSFHVHGVIWKLACRHFLSGAVGTLFKVGLAAICGSTGGTSERRLKIVQGVQQGVYTAWRDLLLDVDEVGSGWGS